MKTAKYAALATRSGLLTGSALLLAVAGLGFAGAAQARDNVSFSVGIGLPGVVVGASNTYPVYTQPVYTQPVYSQSVYSQPVYVQPRPVYIQPQPVYIQPRPVYVQPAPFYVQPAPVFVQQAPVYYPAAPVYYGRPHGDRHHGGGYYVQGPRPGYGQGYYGQRYAPVYYRR